MLPPSTGSAWRRPENKCPKSLCFRLKTGGIGTQRPFHPGDKLGPRGFDHRVKVAGHEAKAEDLPVGFVARLAERRHKELLSFRV